MIAILTPSRHRPERFCEMVEAALSTAADPGSITIYLGTDEDDHGYDAIHHPNVVHVSGERDRLAGWTNRLAGIALEDGAEILASFGDDHRPRTQGWDARVLEAFADLGFGLVYARDGLQDERLPTAPFWSADIIRELGWYFPPVLKHLYADDYWLRLAKDLGRCAYLPDVLIEHLHPSAGKAEEDDINRSNDSHYDEDREAFSLFCRDEHPLILEQLRAVL